jgi:hypothetical protein
MTRFVVVAFAVATGGRTGGLPFPALAFVAFLIAFVGLGIALETWRGKKSLHMLDRWAGRNGLRIVSCERRRFARGPFFWSASKHQVVYRIAVRGVDGRTWEGWARCGSWMLGLWANQVDVRWDEIPSPRREPPGFPVVMPGDRPRVGPPSRLTAPPPPLVNPSEKP